MTHISTNLDTDILPVRLDQIDGPYCITSLCLSNTPFLSLTNHSMQSLRDNKQSFNPAVHHRLFYLYSATA